LESGIRDPIAWTTLQLCYSSVVDTTVDPLVLRIKRAVEEAVGIPVKVQQNPDNTFGLTLLTNQVVEQQAAED